MNYKYDYTEIDRWDYNGEPLAPFEVWMPHPMTRDQVEAAVEGIKCDPVITLDDVAVLVEVEADDATVTWEVLSKDDPIRHTPSKAVRVWHEGDESEMQV